METASIWKDGHRADYSFGDEYIYVNGNGVETSFGAVKCANAYALLFENNAVEVIPVPFTKAETISIDLSKLPLKAAKTLVTLDVNGKAIKSMPINGKTLEIKIDGKAFSYKITQ